VPWLFLLAYTASGLAGLVYEVTWTRLLTLYIGHTTAAASAVVAAFLGGLAAGAGGGGVIASRLSARRSLQMYAVVEIFVAIIALLLPFELLALRPLLEWAYNDGAPGLLFPAVRLLSCLVMIFVPAAALGASFPLAIRWFTSESADAARPSGTLYFCNTAGAAVGALLAGFLLIPSIGMSGATLVGVAASALAAVSVLALLVLKIAPPSQMRQATLRRKPRKSNTRGEVVPSPKLWLAAVVLALSGFASLMHEIAWTRILALVLGPTIYAFAATLAAVIAGLAIGSGVGTSLMGRTRRPAAWLAFALTGAAMTASWTYSLAGRAIPRLVAQQMAASQDVFDQILQQGMLLTAALILPTAICLGAAFPLALSIASDPSRQAAGRFGLVYAVNTIGAVTGSLLAGFVFIPVLGLQNTLRVVSGCLIAATAIVLVWGAVSRNSRIAGVLASAAAVALLVLSPPWDRELLASGAYLYAPFVPRDLDLESLLKAGTLLYYQEGASATVSVKRLTGTTTLAVDGKTDASNRGDMLTQKLVAHLPLLLHENPRETVIIGLGSGVTLGAALTHPIARADVIEISPEVVEASRFFITENHRALEDPRTNLIVGDGRSHLLLSQRKYDVIISEPSNPWIAGVAALFTREFFEAARARLAPGGIICQWANAYNISDADLRAIVATFRSVFPHGTAWLVGADDVLLVAGEEPLDSRLANVQRHWHRPGVGQDLREVAALDPFSIWSLLVGGPAELERYAAGAAPLVDDTMRLEFSGPRDLRGRRSGENGEVLAALLGPDGGPALIRQARASATAAEWRNRAAMMAKRDAFTLAYDDYVRALTLDPNDSAALDGLVRAAILTDRGSDALAWIKSVNAGKPQSIETLIAISKLLAAVGAAEDAVDMAIRAAAMAPTHHTSAAEQLATLYADAGDTDRLDQVVATLQRNAPERAATHYFAAVAALLHGRLDDSVQSARRAMEIDPSYAPTYDLIGAAYTKLGRADEARDAFHASLRLDPHDSTAYTNLGLLELAASNTDRAARYFAEALWLDPDSPTAREGLARAK
jgi:spermidine synthase